MATEHELKLTAPDEETLGRVLADPEVVAASRSDPAARGRRFLATYFDTANRALLERRWSFRIRREGDIWKAALKWGGELRDGVSRREEQEVLIAGPLDHPGDLPAGPLRSRLLEAIPGDTRLVPTVVVDVVRREVDLALAPGTGAELVTDRGRIEAGGRTVPLYEVEIELKEGTFPPLAALGRRLAARHRLVPSTRSKHEIGLALLEWCP